MMKIGHSPIHPSTEPRTIESGQCRVQPLPHGRGSDPERSRDREGVEMARRVTYGDESHEWSDVEGEYLANSGVTFA